MTLLIIDDEPHIRHMMRLTLEAAGYQIDEPGGAFWRLQAERLLSAHVWSEGKGPAGGRLTVRDVSREDLDVAARWELD